MRIPRGMKYHYLNIKNESLCGRGQVKTCCVAGTGSRADGGWRGGPQASQGPSSPWPGTWLTWASDDLVSISFPHSLLAALANGPSLPHGSPLTGKGPPLMPALRIGCLGVRLSQRT